MAKKTLEQCRNHKDLCGVVTRNHGELREGANHTKVFYEDQFVTCLPRHPGDIAKGTLRSIVRALAAIGFVCLILGFGLMVII